MADTPLKDIDLQGETLQYGNVQFGGGDGPLLNGSAVRAMPPQFQMHVRNDYDDTGRVVTGQTCTLNVRTNLYSSTNTLQETQLRDVRRELMTPRKALAMGGTGMGFTAAEPEISWGPRPISCTIRTIGRQLAVLDWTVEFQVAPCTVDQEDFDAIFKAFAFSQSYSLDDEGMLTRVTSGYYEIAPQTDTGTQIADQFRESIVINVPAGFRRVRQEWTESPDKTRMEFAVVDDQLRGDALPQYITRGQGEWSMASEGPGFSRGVASLSATLTVAPGIAPSVAMLQFYLMAAQKRSDYMTLTDNEGSMMPVMLAVQRGLWEQSRTTRFQMQWAITGCVAEFINDAFWKPLSNSGNYAAWATTMNTANVWDQRGVAGVEGDPTNDAAINLCSGAVGVVIATPSPSLSSDDTEESLGIDCEEIDPLYSWLDYDAEIKFQKKERKEWHRQAVAPSRTLATITDPIYGTGGLQTGESFDPTGKEDILESTGLPEQFILLKAKGLRVQHAPVFPTVVSVDGQDVELVEEHLEIGYAFNIGCPVYKMRGYRLYKVKGVVGKLDTAPVNPTVCIPAEPPPEEPPPEEPPPEE